jgi:hypothetical protein
LVTVLSFVVGMSVHVFSAYAQNQTTETTYAPVVVSTDALIVAAIGIISAAAALIKSFVDRGWLDKRIGTVAVMASDASVAINDNRQTIKDLAQNTYDTVKLVNPQYTSTADEKLAPVLDRATVKINEYTPKVERFTELGKKISKSGDNADDQIEAMKDDIPNSIVPS